MPKCGCLGDVNVTLTGNLTATDLTVSGDLNIDSSTFFVDSTTNRVGILDATPSYSLDINGTFRLVGAGIFDSTVAITDDLIVDTNVLFVDVSTNRVGINDATPSYSLDVTGTAQITGAVILGSTVAVSDDLIVDTDVLFVDVSTNRVGINQASPSHALDVVGTVEVTGNSTLTGTLALSDDLVVNTSTLVADVSATSVGVGIAVPTGKLHVNQSGAASAIPSLHLEQDDVSEEFIRFTGTSANGVLTQSLVENADVAVPTLTGWVKVNVQDEGNQLADGAYFMPLYTLA